MVKILPYFYIMGDYFERMRKIKLGQLPKEAVRKKPVPIKKMSAKKKEELKIKAGSDSEMDIFFASLRRGMKNKCLFCGGKTMKEDDEKFHFSLAHLLPKAIFPSVATHPENIIELCFWGESCHTNFDNGKITWEFIHSSHEWLIIKEKLLLVLPAIAPEERKHKLYSRLMDLVYKK